MKRFFLLLSLLLVCQSIHSQIFSKERILNNENFDAPRWSWGYYFGFNSYDYKFEYKDPTQDIAVEKNIGFNVGLLGNLRINDYLDLRLEPGLYYTQRNLILPGFTNEQDALRETNSTYIHLPLLLKVSTKRLNNFKPFILGGVSYSNNLSSNEDNPDDNSAGQFRMKTHTFYYEVGFGIDLYLPYFKFTPSIRGVFAISDELVRDEDPNSPWTGNIEQMASRGVFINFTFQ